jgi:phosphatidylglycerophosphate synthase
MNRREYSSEAFYIQWVFWYSIANVIGVLLFFVLGVYRPVIGINILAIAFYIYEARKKLHNYPWIIGYPNWITLFRFFSICVLGLYLPLLSSYQAFFAFAFIILIDGLDGLVARRTKQITDIGGRLDGETDAFMVLLLTLYHIDIGKIPDWIILPGIMRHVFGILSYFYKSPKEYTSRRFRATIAVIFFCTLLFAFILNDYFARVTNTIAGTLILSSFGISLYLMVAKQISDHKGRHKN